MRQDEKQITETTIQSTAEEKDAMLQELNTTKEQLNNISKQYEELEAKSKADIKVLVKEVKSLRKSQKELKQVVGQSLSEKSEAEVTVCTKSICYMLSFFFIHSTKKNLISIENFTSLRILEILVVVKANHCF